MWLDEEHLQVIHREDGLRRKSMIVAIRPSIPTMSQIGSNVWMVVLQAGGIGRDGEI
jgi:hypothetical protein